MGAGNNSNIFNLSSTAEQINADTLVYRPVPIVASAFRFLILSSNSLGIDIEITLITRVIL